MHQAVECKAASIKYSHALDVVRSNDFVKEKTGGASGFNIIRLTL